MHASFPDWYRLINLNPQAETIQNRWKVVESKASKLDSDHIQRLTTYFLSKSLDDRPLVEELNKWFQDADPTFSVSNNELELRVLSGALLAALLDDGKPTKQLVTALTVLCSSFGLKRAALFLNDLRSIAIRQMNDQAVELRKLDELNEDDLPQPDATDLKEFSKQVNSMFKKTEHRIRVLSEESNIGWWLVKGWSNDLNKALGDSDRHSVCLLVGKELADLTLILSEPLSARSLIVTMLNKAKPKGQPNITIPQAVNATPRSWRETLTASLKNDKFNLVAPITFALRKSLETAEQNEWIPVFETASQLSAKQKLPEMELAHQFYRERMLLRMIATMGSK